MHATESEGFSLSGPLPEGVVITPLTNHPDDRGSFTEIFRRAWPTGVDPLQFNLATTRQGVMRGCHVHLRHDEFFLSAKGRIIVGLSDIRPASPTFGTGVLIDLSDERMALLTIPHGVVHGFYAITESLLLAGATHYYDPLDDLGCRWDDAELNIPWPALTPSLSERDSNAGSLAALRPQIV